MKMEWSQAGFKTSIIIVRHAESSNNCIFDEIRRKFGDDLPEDRVAEEELKMRDPDCQLSELGKLQASKLASYLSVDGFSRVFDSDLSSWVILTSPMQRSLITCNEVIKSLNMKAFIHPKLHENGGCYDSNHQGLPGMNSLSMESLFPLMKCLPGMENGWYNKSKAETTNEFRQRAQEIANWLKELHLTPVEQRVICDKIGFQNVMLFMHGNLMNAVLACLFQCPIDNMLITHHNTGYTLLELYTSKREPCSHIVTSARYFNRIDHINMQHERHLVTGNRVIDDHWIQELLEE